MSRRYPHSSDMANADLKALKGIAREDQEDDDHEPRPKLCICGDCGRGFMKGEQGDNEEYCLRCERQSVTRGMTDDEYDDFDRYQEDD